MQTIIIKSKDQNLALGGTTKREFEKQGYVSCVFYIHPTYIGYSIEGFESCQRFRFKTKTNGESFSNLMFLAKFKNVIKESEELRSILKSKGKLEL